jgi:hypothetical protein
MFGFIKFTSKSQTAGEAKSQECPTCVLKAVEVKTPKGKLEPSQEREIPRMQAAGATILIVRSLKELQESLDALEVGELL